MSSIGNFLLVGGSVSFLTTCCLIIGNSIDVKQAEKLHYLSLGLIVSGVLMVVVGGSQNRSPIIE
jgi:hypothetical protein